MCWEGNDAAGPLFQVYVGNSTGQASFVTGPDYATNEWYHLVVTCDEYSTFTSTWQVMTNYGSASVDGVYMPGSVSASVGGPDNRFGGFGTDTNLVPGPPARHRPQNWPIQAAGATRSPSPIVQPPETPQNLS